MGMFEQQKIALLKEKIETIRYDAHNNERFSLFDAKFSVDFFKNDLEYEKLKYMYDLINQWDKKCNLSYNVGISLDKFAEDNTVMFQRTNFGLDRESEGLMPDDKIFNIMNQGLKNFGHANAVGGGAFSSEIPSLTLTMTPLDGLTGYINLIGSYKSNDAIIFAAFPKDLVNSDGNVVSKDKYSCFYDLSEETPRIKPEYLMGILLKKNNGFDEFYTRDEIIESYSAKNTK